MIQLKKLISEQPDPRGTAAVATQNKILAKQIYDSKGYVWDDPKGTVAAIKQIKTVQQYQAVNNELKKLTGGRDIATYLKSFLDASDKKTWELILSYLKTQFSSNPEATLYPLGKVYFNLMNNSTDPTSGSNGIKYVSADYVKWWKRRQLDIISGISTSPLSTITKTVQEHRHELMILGQIVTAFIPLVGPVASAGLGIADAKMYHDEGDDYAAGLSLVLSLLPGGSKVVKSLVPKLLAKSGRLTAAEASILKKVATSKTFINEQLAKLIKQGVESGKIKESSLKSIKWIKPVAKGVYQAVGTSVMMVTPVLAYDAAWNAANPNVTELEMQIELDAEEQLFKKQVDALFNKALTDKKRGITYVKGQKDPILIRPESVESTKLQDILTNTTNNKPLQLEAMATPDELEGNTETGENHSLLPKIVFWGGVAIALLVGKGALNIRRKLLGTSTGSKYTIRQQWQMFRDRRRINKIMKSNNVKGLTRSKYRSLLRSITSESRDNIQKLIQDVQRGIYTPEQAVREFQNVYPGEVTDKYLQLIRRRFDEIIPESPTTPVNTDYKRRNIGFQQRGSNIPKDWKYPNVTPDQFNRLSLNQKIALQQNTNLSWSSLQRTR
jgi:hypothetical protein